MENIQQLKEYLKSYRFFKDSAHTISSLIILFENESNEDQRKLAPLFSIMEHNDFSVLLKNALYLLIEEKWYVCSDILKNINQLNKELEKNVLIQKYINGYTWEQISEFFNYSLRKIYNIHNRALHNLLNIMQKS